jgi:hypothetical protein
MSDGHHISKVASQFACTLVHLRLIAISLADPEYHAHQPSMREEVTNSSKNPVATSKVPATNSPENPVTNFPKLKTRY